MTWTEWLASADGIDALRRCDPNDLATAWVAGFDEGNNLACQIFATELVASGTLKLSGPDGQNLTTNHHASKKPSGPGITTAGQRMGARKASRRTANPTQKKTHDTNRINRTRPD